jgi:hypothetical protein
MDYYQRRNFIAGEELGEVGTVQRQRVCVAELWCELFGKQKADMTKFNTKDLHTIMRAMEGWEEGKYPVSIKNYGMQRVYRRVEKSKSCMQEGKNGALNSKNCIHEKKLANIQSIQLHTPN